MCGLRASSNRIIVSIMASSISGHLNPPEPDWPLMLTTSQITHFVDLGQVCITSSKSGFLRELPRNLTIQTRPCS